MADPSTAKAIGSLAAHIPLSRPSPHHDGEKELLSPARRDYTAGVQGQASAACALRPACGEKVPAGG